MYQLHGRLRSGEAPGHNFVGTSAHKSPHLESFLATAENELSQHHHLNLQGEEYISSSYTTNYVTIEGKSIEGTKITLVTPSRRADRSVASMATGNLMDRGVRADYPSADASREILKDVCQRAENLVANRDHLPPGEVARQFAEIAHGYHQAMPFERGSDGVSQAFLRGLYLAATGEKMPQIPFLDVKAQLMSRENFENWFREQAHR